MKFKLIAQLKRDILPIGDNINQSKWRNLRRIFLSESFRIIHQQLTRMDLKLFIWWPIWALDPNHVHLSPTRTLARLITYILLDMWNSEMFYGLLKLDVRRYPSIYELPKSEHICLVKPGLKVEVCALSRKENKEEKRVAWKKKSNLLI